jgi:hypothetical protein
MTQVTAGPALTDALDVLLQEAADASVEASVLLANCRACRNSVLYLLDTPGQATTPRFIRVRIEGLLTGHESHSDPGHPDYRIPRIRVTGD